MTSPFELEISPQLLTVEIAATEAVHQSLPLHDMQAVAPVQRRPYVADRVKYPISNDDCTGVYLSQLQARTANSDYQRAINRVALMIGESSIISF